MHQQLTFEYLCHLLWLPCVNLRGTLLLLLCALKLVSLVLSRQIVSNLLGRHYKCTFVLDDFCQLLWCR